MRKRSLCGEQSEGGSNEHLLYTAKEAVEVRKEAEAVVGKKADRLEAMPVFITWPNSRTQLQAIHHSTLSGYQGIVPGPVTGLVRSAPICQSSTSRGLLEVTIQKLTSVTPPSISRVAGQFIGTPTACSCLSKASWPVSVEI